MKHITIAILLLCSYAGFCQQVSPVLNTPTNIPVNAPVGPPPNLSNLSNASLRNYVRTYAPQYFENNASSAAFSIGSGTPNTITKTMYVDGLGRPLQEVLYKPNPVYSSQDLVTSHAYDDLGREAYNYLPYSRSAFSSQGRLDVQPLTNQSAFYNTNYQGEEYYAKNIYDNSPLNRTTGVQAPGKSWVGSGRTKTINYETNNSFTYGVYVPLWTIACNGPADLPITNGQYGESELSVTIVQDEDGHRTREYKDKSGRLVATSSAEFSVYYFLAQTMTHYVYDALGRLRFVIPPLALAQNNNGVITTSIANELCYQYWYDIQGRITEKRIPGKGPERFVYDARSRPVLTQDANLSSQGKWAFTIYDALNRPISTGLWSVTASRDLLQNVVNNPTPASWYGAGTMWSFLKNYYIYHQDVSFVTDAEILTRTLYDDYDYDALSMSSLSAFNPNYNGDLTGAAPFAQLPISTNQTRGLATGGAVRILNPDGSYGISLPTGNFYDSKGRLIQQQSKNIGSHLDVSTFQYYYAGQLASTVVDHGKLDLTPGSHQNIKITRKHELNYRSGAEKSVHMRVNSQPWMKIKEYQWTPLGQPFKKLVGDFEEIYTYNVRGWLTGINPSYVDNGSATSFGPFFGEKLSYDQGFASKLYSGDVAGMQWRGAGGAPKQFYGYTYEILQPRLAHAEYAKWESPGQGQPATWTKVNTDYTVSGITYDVGGNIQTMNQRGPTYSSASWSAVIVPGDMDKLAYSYWPGTNKLTAVAENSSANPIPGTPDFRSGTSSSQQYGYDQNGNLIIDLNKGITASITYNHFNKPMRIVVGNKGVIEYTYDGAGNRLRKTISFLTPAAPQEVWDYIGPFVYKNNALQYVSHDEGRCRPDPQDAEKFIYDYFIKDHLKNVRSVVATEATTVTGPSNTLSTNARVYRATMEVGSANTESLLWDKLNEVRDLKPSSLDPADQKAARLEGTDPERRIGTAIMLRVMPGDKFDLSSRSYYENDGEAAEGTSSNALAEALLTTLAGGTIAGETPVAEMAENIQILNSAFGSGTAFASTLEELQYTAADPEKPQSFLNYIVFDENMHVVKDISGAIQLDGMDQWTTRQISSQIDVTQAGYLAVFTSSVAKEATWWDQIELTLYRGQVLEENHYYPFGLTLSTNSANAAEQNKYKLTTKELQSDFKLNWYDFGARMFDEQLGRWIGVDPLSEKYSDLSSYCYLKNNPSNSFDPDGMRVFVNGTGADNFTALVGQRSGLQLYRDGADLQYRKEQVILNVRNITLSVEVPVVTDVNTSSAFRNEVIASIDGINGRSDVTINASATQVLDVTYDDHKLGDVDMADINAASKTPSFQTALLGHIMAERSHPINKNKKLSFYDRNTPSHAAGSALEGNIMREFHPGAKDRNQDPQVERRLFGGSPDGGKTVIGAINDYGVIKFANVHQGIVRDNQPTFDQNVVIDVAELP